MKKVFLIISLIMAGLAILPFKDYAEDEEEIKLFLGEIKIISVSNPTRVVLGNPEVADVTNVTKTDMTISPKAPGTTTLVFWDNFGEQSYRIKVYSQDIQLIKRRIDSLLAKLNFPNVYTKADEDEGKVFILGNVKSANDKKLLGAALEPLKDKTIDLTEIREEEAVVEIEVQVLELSRDATKTLGFSLPLSGAITATEPSGKYPMQLRQSMEAIFHVFDWRRAALFSTQIDYLIQEGKARVLSRPRLACQSGKEAELLVGGEKPILTTEAAVLGGAGSTKVEYKEYGIKLKIKPTVAEDNKIKLVLKVEVSEVGAAEILGTEDAPTAKAYPLNKRTASTELFLMDGQTLAIGGLIKQKKEEDVRKTAGLGDIPIIGLLFRNKTTKIGGGSGEKGDTELFITLTPTIVSGKKVVEAKKITEPKISYPARIENLPAAMAGYAQIIQKRILENLTYPSLAKEAGLQGTVKLSLHLSNQGELLEAKVKSSSGHKLLDDNAVYVAREVSSYPAFPSSIEQKELWIDVPIVYKLD